MSLGSRKLTGSSKASNDGSPGQTCPCCGGPPRRTVRDLFDQALHRRSDQRGEMSTGECPEGWVAGRLMTAPPLLAVRYYLELDGPQITGADYHSTTCVVLLAYSELLRDMARGTELSVMLTLRDVDLISELPDVPAARHDRATLVARAFHSAASAARES